jgi:hypothetical protein
VLRHVLKGTPFRQGGRPELLEFAISAREEAAICAEPATLQAESQEEPDDSLEGFEASPSCKGLMLEGGDCDPIHLYWNRKRRGVSWWRN